MSNPIEVFEATSDRENDSMSTDQENVDPGRAFKVIEELMKDDLLSYTPDLVLNSVKSCEPSDPIFSIELKAIEALTGAKNEEVPVYKLWIDFEKTNKESATAYKEKDRNKEFLGYLNLMIHLHWRVYSMAKEPEADACKEIMKVVQGKPPQYSEVTWIAHCLDIEVKSTSSPQCYAGAQGALKLC